MRVLLSTYGWRGDVEPMVDSRCSCGHSAPEVPVCAPPDFAELLVRVGVPLVPRSSTRSPRRPRDVMRRWRPA